MLPLIPKINGPTADTINSKTPYAKIKITPGPGHWLPCIQPNRISNISYKYFPLAFMTFFILFQLSSIPHSSLCVQIHRLFETWCKNQLSLNILQISTPSPAQLRDYLTWTVNGLLVAFYGCSTKDSNTYTHKYNLIILSKLNIPSEYGSQLIYYRLNASAPQIQC